MFHCCGLTHDYRPERTERGWKAVLRCSECGQWWGEYVAVFSHLDECYRHLDQEKARCKTQYVFVDRRWLGRTLRALERKYAGACNRVRYPNYHDLPKIECYHITTWEYSEEYAEEYDAVRAVVFPMDVVAQGVASAVP